MRPIAVVLLTAACTRPSSSPETPGPATPPTSTGAKHAESAGASSRPGADVGEPRIDAARRALAPLKRGLQETLTEALAASGPAGALSACRMEAPKVTGDAQTLQVEVGRAALRARNPDNHPEPWMKPLIANLTPQPGVFETVELPDGRMGYVEAIPMQAMCLQCHGSELGADVTAALAQSYPNDEATGFQVGDLRGVFWAKVGSPHPVE